MPRELAKRPLTLPEKSQELTIGGGRQLTAHDAFGYDWSREFFAYRLSLSERVTVGYPLMLAYRLGDASALHAAIGTGFDLHPGGIDWQDTYTGDPRVPNARVNGPYWGPRFFAVAKEPVLDGAAAVLQGASFGMSMFRTRTFARWAEMHIGFVVDVTRWLSLGAGALVSTWLSFDEDRARHRLVLGGEADDGLVPVPAVAVHISDQIDLIGWPIASIDLDTSEVRGGAIGGLDWHFGNGSDESAK